MNNARWYRPWVPAAALAATNIVDPTAPIDDPNEHVIYALLLAGNLMASVRITRHLKRFFPDIEPCTVAGDCVAELLVALDEVYPGIRDYIVNDAGALRTHVNVFVDGSRVEDRQTLSDPVGPDQEVYIMQALSGG